MIFGTLSGEQSLLLREYYGNPRKRIWKVNSAINNTELPSSKDGKIALLKRTKIGVWDVAHSALIQGNLDSAIKDECPNDLGSLIATHPKLKVIAFNGKKAESLFDK